MKNTLIMSFRPKRRNLPGIKCKLQIKKKIYAVCVGLITLNSQLITHNSFSQNVGVNDNGATPNANAILDVDASSNDKGLLIPRITTTQRIGISGLGAGDEGLTVYDETTTSFWFWNGSQWTEMLNSGSSWELAGNTGTTNGTHFLGTTDAQNLDIRTNNVIRVRVTQKGQIEVLNTGNSVFVGEGAGANDDLSSNLNTFIGYNAGNVNTTGSHNTGIGHTALVANTTGYRNTAVGIGALQSNTTGFYNTAVSMGALVANTTGSNNSAVGRDALAQNTSGVNNTAMGRSTLGRNTTGYSNVAVGISALERNISTSNLVAVGDSALFWNTGASNTAIGSKALFTNTTGVQNVANGYQALYNNTNSVGNTASGHRALHSNTTGASNTAVGNYALHNNTTSDYNTAIGVWALRHNTTGTYNNAMGVFALRENILGSYNVAIGQSAMYHNTNASKNTVVGQSAMYVQSYNNGGVRWDSYNVAIGHQALYLNQSTATTNGINNSALGSDALGINTTGSNNTGVGYFANVSTGTLSNATAIGNSATVNASNKIRLGNAAVTVIEGQVGYTYPSDGRFKTNIVYDEVVGLEFINQLKPVVYNFDTRKFEEFLTQNMPDSIRKRRLSETDFGPSTAIRQTGFIAQEVEQVMEELGYNFSGLHRPVDENDNYSVSYSQFVVPLVKAVQEQQQIIEGQKLDIVELEAKLEAKDNQIEARLKLLEEYLKVSDGQ